MTTTEFDMNETLKDALYEAGIEATVQDFTEVGMLTNDTGIVIKMEDGRQFKITVEEVL